ncbi:MAG: M20/M25/M40 family metallo-hydrolase [Bacteroidia bacterium]|nr:M20/M25/M40 family metallo-hydrolase [Bacteroidia bacterium]
MNLTRTLFVLIFIFYAAVLSAQNKKHNPEITAEELKEFISYLASDNMRGRKTGTAEDKQAAIYIKDLFAETGLKLLGNSGFQYFEAVTDVEAGKNNSLKFESFEGKMQEDFIPFSFTKNGSVTAKMVFAGYGFDINTDSIKWNDYKTVDVKNKWVMILRGDPDMDNMNSPFLEYSQERYKVMTARDKGAAGVIFITGKSQEKDDKIVPLYFDKTLSDAGIIVINIKRSVANMLLGKTNRNVEEIEKKINTSKTADSFEIPVEISATAEVLQSKVTTQNVVAMLEGSDPELKNEYIVIGGHFDHLGMGGKGSGSRNPDTVAIHNGADDNASGVAAVIELAGKLMANKNILKRSVIFVAFAGEEMGMLGSKEFVKNPPVDKKQIKAMFNFDMVGRLKKDRKALSVSGTGTASEWDSLLNKYSKNRSFEINFTPDGYGPSDHAAFYSENIPVLFFTTGAHEDYHTPFDDVEKLDLISEKAIFDYACDIITDVAGSEKPLTFKEAGSKNKTRFGRRFKVTLGIIPDVAGTTKDGLGVDGVKKDGPAEKGGMKKGDIIIAMDGQKVTNIYDYMFRLAKLEHGKTVIVEVLRGGKKEVLLIQL